MSPHNNHEEPNTLIKCPFCSEKIQPDAKKCRFCGEWLNKIEKNKPIIKTYLSCKAIFCIWAASLLVFHLILLLGKYDLSKTTPILTYAIIGDVLVGSGAFIALSAELIRNTFNRKTWKKGLKYSALTVVAMAAFFGSFVLLAGNSKSTARALGPDQIIESVNQKRQANGKGRLQTEPKLSTAAKAYAEDMCQKNYYIYNPSGKKYTDFIDEAEYSYSNSGLTITEGFYDSNLLVDNLMNNETTKNTILSDEVTSTGVGVVRCGLGVLNKTTDVIVQIYAKPSDEVAKVSPRPKVAGVSTTNTKTNTSVSAGSQSSLVTCIGPDGKQFETTMDECKNLNEKWGKPVDYMLNCNIHPDCGGGTVHMSKSQCDKPCSGLNRNTNTTTTSTTSTNNSAKTAVFISYGGYTVYCPSQNVGAVMQMASTMESKKMEWAKQYNDCVDLHFKTDSCLQSCNSTSLSENNNCWNTYGYSGEQTTACTKTASANFDACIKNCPLANCDWVYAEQKNITNQINSLCK